MGTFILSPLGGLVMCVQNHGHMWNLERIHSDVITYALRRWGLCVWTTAQTPTMDFVLQKAEAWRGIVSSLLWL